MAPEFFAETTAAHIPGFPQFLREIWDHLYPGSAPPTYRVFYERPNGSVSEFTATVHLRPKSSPVGISHTITSGTATQLTRAVQEAAGAAVIFLRTHDPVMRRCTRYVYFPRVDLNNGEVFFPSQGDPTSALTSLLRYTTLLHQYLNDTLYQFASLRANLAGAGRARAHRASSHRPTPFTTFTHSSLDRIRRRISPAPATRVPSPPFSTSGSTAHYYSHFTPVRSQRRRVRADTPSYSADSRDGRASPDYSPEED